MRAPTGSARRPSRSEPDTRGSLGRCRARAFLCRGEARVGAPFERPHHLVAEHHLGDLLEVMPGQDLADARVQEQRGARLAWMRRAVRKEKTRVLLRREEEDLLGTFDA